MNDILKLTILETEIKNILNIYFNNVFDSGTYFNFRCNVCGDSKKSKSKKRGYIIKSCSPWKYYCHNCHYSANVERWMKEFFPLNYKQYVKELMKSNIIKKKNVIKVEKKEKIEKIEEKKEKIEKINYEMVDTKHFKKIENFPEIIEYCKKRKIPESVYIKWYYAIDGKYKNRLIITFYNDKNKIYYYQGRLMGKGNNKYLSREGNHNTIYNYYLVNNEKPVIILEGPIDSIFVENSIAVTGLKFNNLDIFKYKYYLLDNDKDGKKKSIKLLNKQCFVFNWQLFLKKYSCEKNIKDVNDFIINNNYGIEKLTWDIIKDYFTNNFYDRIYFL